MKANDLFEVLSASTKWKQGTGAFYYNNDYQFRINCLAKSVRYEEATDKGYKLFRSSPYTKCNVVDGVLSIDGYKVKV